MCWSGAFKYFRQNGTLRLNTPSNVPTIALMDIAALRNEYTKHGLRRDMLDASPFDQFQKWFEQALKAEIREPNAMSLGTADASGRPGLRTVLLKGFDHKGFVFFTNYESAKARQIEENSQVALMFLWLELERQVVVNGRAEKISNAASMKYFVTRPLGSRLGAWSSSQSSIITSRQILEMKLDQMKRKFANGNIPLPTFWGGYRVVPDTFEFWQGRPNRLHDRFRYSLAPGETTGTKESMAQNPLQPSKDDAEKPHETPCAPSGQEASPNVPQGLCWKIDRLAP